MEIHILDNCSHTFSDNQFGFIEGRGTDLAVSLTHDVISYCTSRGSPVYACSLDAEGAFDGIPHCVLFRKAIGIIPDIFWRLLVKWYGLLTVKIKWNNQSSKAIPILKGTRQGGISSPFLFNLFYQDLVDTLNSMNAGIVINDTTYNVFCYADDLLLTSTSVTGLQRMIDTANHYIVSHGLRFNPSKTQCMTFGKPLLDKPTTWMLNDSLLDQVVKLKYLGVALSNDPRSHADERLKSCRQAFYALQGSGLCQNGLSAQTLAYVWSTAVRPVLTYGIHCVHHSKPALRSMDKLQCKLLKSILGLKDYCHNTPLLNALNINSITQTREIQELKLLKRAILGTSRSSKFYCFLLSLECTNHIAGDKTLVKRCHRICEDNGFNMFTFLNDSQYASHAFKSLVEVPTDDGVIDSARQLLQFYSMDNVKLLNML